MQLVIYMWWLAERIGEFNESYRYLFIKNEIYNCLEMSQVPR